MLPFRILRQKLLVALLFAALTASAQVQSFRIACLAFYNVENLFDTIKSPNTNDYDFLPDGIYRWNSERYQKKLNDLAFVIRQIGTSRLHSGPTLLGLCEIENREVVEDLMNTPPLAEMNYGIVHHPSPDRRGVGVALAYQRNRFEVLDSRSAELNIPDNPDFRTRNQLVVSGVLDGLDTLHVVVVHYPSKRGGERRSAPLRNAAAQLTRSIVDSIYATNENAKIVILGDFNDDPDSRAILRTLGARPTPEATERGGLHNTSHRAFKSGIGSYAWNDSWTMIDQIIVSQPLLSSDRSTYTFWNFNVFNPEFLKQKDGRFRGYPWRMFAGTTYLGGYSDHFPVYIFLVRAAE